MKRHNTMAPMHENTMMAVCVFMLFKLLSGLVVTKRGFDLKSDGRDVGCPVGSSKRGMIVGTDDG